MVGAHRPCHCAPSASGGHILFPEETQALRVCWGGLGVLILKVMCQLRMQTTPGSVEASSQEKWLRWIRFLFSSVCIFGVCFVLICFILYLISCMYSSFGICLFVCLCFCCWWFKFFFFFLVFFFICI